VKLGCVVAAFHYLILASVAALLCADHILREAVIVMSYGHAGELAGRAGTPPVDPVLYERSDVRGFLAAHDIATLYRVLKDDAGISQRQIAQRTGQSQSEVSEIVKGRQVLAYDLLVRIADGLGIPLELMGLSWWGAGGTYCGEVTVADPSDGGDEGMLRRRFQHLLGVGAVAAFGVQVTGIGKLVTGLATPGMPLDLPSRIGRVDVEMLRGHIEHLRTLARTYGGQARAAVALVEWADQWLTADASDTTRRALRAELSDLHCLAAWCCHDSGAAARSHHHFARSVELATDAGDGYRAAYALRHAGMMLVDRSEPDNALKLTQLGHLRSSAAPRDDPRVAVLQAWLHVVSALALARLDGADSTRRQARSELARARDGWEPPHAHARADMDLITALTYLHLGQLDAAESAAAVSVQTFKQGTDRREGVVSDITMARLHVQTGEPDGLRLAAEAIDSVAPLRSGLARAWLMPLTAVLEARSDRDARELARMARHVAATRV